MRATLAVTVLPFACGQVGPVETGETAPDPPATVSSTRDALDGGTLDEGDGVALAGVVATTPVSQGGEAFFVQDSGGGERSGIRVHLAGVFDPVPVHPGAVLDLSGTIAWVDGAWEVAVTAASDVVRTGTGDPVADPLSCAATDPGAREGGLVAVADLATTGPTDAFGETPTTCGYLLDDLFVDVDLAEGTTCASATGVILRVRGDVRLAPRDAADLVSCQVPDSHPTPASPAWRAACALSSS
jgi:hypothetical protein